MKSVSEVEIMLFFNGIQHYTVNISIIYTNLIVLFAITIYNIYNIYSDKVYFNGLYDREISSRKMGNHSTPGTSALRTGQNTGRYSVWGTWAIPKDVIKTKDGRYKSVDTHE